MSTLPDNVVFPKLEDSEENVINLIIKYDKMEDISKAFDADGITSEWSVKYNIDLPEEMIAEFKDAFPELSIEDAMSWALGKIIWAYMDHIQD